MPRRKKKNVKQHKRSFLLTIGTLVLVCYFVFSFFSNRSDIKKAQSENAEILAECEAQEYENAELERILAEGGEEEYIERIARDELGYVYPDERVYVDVYLED